MGFLTGKAGQNSSSNQAYPYLQQTYAPQVQQGVGATNQMGALLGLGGDTAGANQAFQNFQNSTGFQNVLGNAMRGVSGSAAARGLLGSGSTAQALQGTAGNLAQQSFGNYLGQLGNVGQMGLQAGGLVRSAGQRSNQTGATPGLLSVLSDRRAKTDIKKIDEFPDGLGIYEFRYKWGDEYHIGVMAQEVANLRPWALGPEINGYMTVNYEAL